MNFLHLNSKGIRRTADFHFSNSWEVRFFKGYEVRITTDYANYLYGYVQPEKQIFNMPALDVLRVSAPHKQEKQNKPIWESPLVSSEEQLLKHKELSEYNETFLPYQKRKRVKTDPVLGTLKSSNSPIQSWKWHLYVYINIYFLKSTFFCKIYFLQSCYTYTYWHHGCSMMYNLSYYLYSVIFVLLEVKPKAIKFMCVTVIYLFWL